MELIKFHEKNPNVKGTLANGAVFIFDKSTINFIRDLNVEAPDISLDLIPRLLGQINIFINNDVHIDIGTFRNWNFANMHHSDINSFNSKN